MPIYEHVFFHPHMNGFVVDTKPLHMRSRISMISISYGKEIEDVQLSFLKLAEICVPNPLRFEQFFDAVPEMFAIFLDEEYKNQGRCLRSKEIFHSIFVHISEHLH